MQKKLIAVAVAGALGAPALALAQASTVQIYGKVTAEYGYVDQGDGKPKTDMLQNPGGSAIGVKGEEALGGGLSAWFQYETSADIRGQNNGDGFGSRNSALGMKGAFGNVHIGRWDTPFKRATNVGMIGAGDTGLLGAAFLFAGNSTGTGAVGGLAPSSLSRNVWKRREASQIYYESPTFSGLNILAAYSSANATGSLNSSTAAKPRVESLAALYKNGPLEVSGGYERHSDFGSAGGGNQDRGWTLNAAYTFMGNIKVAAAFVDYKYEITSGSDLKKKNWMLGLDWHINGPHNLEASYLKAGDSTGSATAADTAASGVQSGNGFIAAPGSGTGGKLYQIAYRHDFSKRTQVKLAYVKLDNDSAARYSLGGLATVPAASAGTSQNAWVMYAQHTF